MLRHQESPPKPGFPHRSRMAATVAVRGFHSAAAPSQPGMVAGGTKTFDSTVGGNAAGYTASDAVSGS